MPNFSVCLLEVQLEPLSAAVLRGSKASFNCSTTLPPVVMTWRVNGRLELIIQETGVLNNTERFSARNLTTPGNYKWEFTISPVQRDDAGEVSCQVFGGTTNIATLSVQERGSVEIIGGNHTEKAGVQIEFECRAIGWFPKPNMSWSINGLSMGNCNSSSIAQGNLFNSNCSLKLTVVKNSSVQCFVSVPALNSMESSTIFLTVERGSVEIIGGNRTETKGVQIEFECRAIGWFPKPNMSWSINGLSMGNCNSSFIAQGNLFNSNCSLKLTVVKNSSVQCFVSVPALNSMESSTVFLTVVQESIRDQTILIAVTVSFSAAALLFLLIFGICFCCKRRKRKNKSTYKEEVRRAQLESHNRMPANVRGRDNHGHITDERDDVRDTDGEIWHTNTNKQQMPYEINNSIYMNYDLRKHRHATMV
ncbi:immunoglobulin superfamily member 5-like [Xyrauchen texanus]|uniref:immunoglobulin superfamily member 5-like n=1 Tax=Xyrauchen texanus TaxID=154827 RepID=UPI002242AD22|nr:immunoglobulin superfamily member 5-like [Xyrauchen texanus]